MAAIARNSLASVNRLQVVPVTSVVCIHKRDSSNVVRDQASNLTAYKRGRGGRSSFSGMVATVFGATGFLGKYVVNKLGKIGSQVIVPYRGDPYYTRDLKLAGDLGQILFQPFHLQDDESIRKSLKYSNVVINLIGREYPTKNFDFQEVHVEGAARIAHIAKEMGVERLVHVSALNASPSPQSIYMKDGTDFFRSKFYGEQAVQNIFPEATIIRPADMYGPQDRFFSYYTHAVRQAGGNVPLWKKGEQTIKMPVFVQDVAAGIIEVVQDPETAGHIYQCVGPYSYHLSEIVDFIYRYIRWPGGIRKNLGPLFRMRANILGRLPTGIVVHPDRLEMEHISDVLEDERTLEDLGITLTTLPKRAQFELKKYRQYRHYEEQVGEFDEPEPPPALAREMVY